MQFVETEADLQQTVRLTAAPQRRRQVEVVPGLIILEQPKRLVDQLFVELVLHENAWRELCKGFDRLVSGAEQDLHAAIEQAPGDDVVLLAENVLNLVEARDEKLQGVVRGPGQGRIFHAGSNQAESVGGMHALLVKQSALRQLEQEKPCEQERGGQQQGDGFRFAVRFALAAIQLSGCVKNAEHLT